MRSQIVERSLPPLLLFEVKSLREVGQTFFNPRTERQKRRVSELVNRLKIISRRIFRCKRCQQKSAALEWRGIGIGQFGRFRFLPLRSKPLGDEGNDSLCRLSKGCGRSLVAF